ncbi:MAG: hypothetical protein WBP85_13055, partial [Terracidiphilus sp.]
MARLGKRLIYILCVAIGIAIGHYMFEGSVAAYASVLISYHLYFFFLLATAKEEETRSLPVARALLYHVLFLGLQVGLTYARWHIPFFYIVRLLIPGLALLEVRWLLSQDHQHARSVKQTVQEPLPLPVVAEEPTGDDQEAFREYLMQPNRIFRKPGISVPEEFNLWFADRQRRKALEAALAAAAAKAAEAAANSPAPVEAVAAREVPKKTGLGLTDWMRSPAPTLSISPESLSKPESPASDSIPQLTSDRNQKEPEAQEYSALFAAQHLPPLPTAAFSSESTSDQKEPELQGDPALSAVDNPTLPPAETLSSDTPSDLKEPESQQAPPLLPPTETLSSNAPSDQKEPESQELLASFAVENPTPTPEAPLPSESPNGQTKSELQDYLASFAVDNPTPTPEAPLPSENPNGQTKSELQDYLASFAIETPTPTPEAPLPSETPNGQTESESQDYLALFAVPSPD